MKQRGIRDKNEINCLLELAKSSRSPNSFFSSVSQLYRLPQPQQAAKQEPARKEISISKYDNTLSAFSRTTLRQLEEDDKAPEELHP